MQAVTRSTLGKETHGICHRTTIPKGFRRAALDIHIGPILDDRLKEKILKPERVPSVITLCVCLCVHARTTGHRFWPMNLIFGLSDPWDMRKKRIFLFFEILILTLFIVIFHFFLLI